MNRIANIITTTIALCVVLCLTPTTAKADSFVFDFENQTANEELTTLTLIQPGLTATITRPDSIFTVENLGDFPLQNTPSAFGQRSLSPTGDTESNTPFVINFSRVVSQIAIDMGDASSDLDTLTLETFSGANATGTRLASLSLTLVPAATPFVFNFATLSISAPGINSVRVLGGSSAFGNSVFYDNLRVTTAAVEPIPEPATLLLLGTGMTALATRLRRLHRKRKANLTIV